MKVGIMQPYFAPYIGYFQLINAVDKFVIYDNIKYTKKGWINRNRLLQNAKDEIFTIPLKKDSDFLNIVNRELSLNWSTDRNKLLNKISNNYKKANFYEEVMPIIEAIILHENHNLFEFIKNSIYVFSDILNIETEFVISSTIEIDENLKSQDKVLAICENLNADIYINPIGGVELYQSDVFNEKNIELQFLKAIPEVYNQKTNKEFIPFLSIIDVLVFNGIEKTKSMVKKGFEIITN